MALASVVSVRACACACACACVRVRACVRIENTSENSQQKVKRKSSIFGGHKAPGMNCRGKWSTMAYSKISQSRPWEHQSYRLPELGESIQQKMDFRVLLNVVCSSVRPFVCSSIRLFVHSSVRPFVCSSIRLFAHSSVRPFVCSSIRLFLHSSVRLFYDRNPL